MKILKAGTRLKSAVCDTEVMVIRAGGAEVDLACGGREMLAIGETRDPAAAPAADQTAGCLVGKRYVDGDDKFEFLCTKGGKGTLALNGAALTVKQAKALPSSD
jgi:hypothetical protein